MYDLREFLAERATFNGRAFLIQRPAEALPPGHDDRVNEFYDELDRLASDSFGTELSVANHESARDQIINAGLLAVLLDGNRVAGFASADVYPANNMLYLHGIVLLNDLKRHGTGTMLVQSLITYSRMRFLGFTTQNPAMFRLLEKVCIRTYPSPEQVDIPNNVMDMARQQMSDKFDTFDSTTFVIRDEYSRCLYPDIPMIGDERIDTWFSIQLRIQNGQTRDAFFFVGDTV